MSEREPKSPMANARDAAAESARRAKEALDASARAAKDRLAQSHETASRVVASAKARVPGPGMTPAEAARVDAIRASHGADAHAASHHDTGHDAGHGDAHGGHGGHAPKRPPTAFEKKFTLFVVGLSRLFGGQPKVDAHGHDKVGRGHHKEESSHGVLGAVEGAASAVDEKIEAGFDHLIKATGGKSGKKGGTPAGGHH